MTSLSEGRTLLSRAHANIGVKVHCADGARSGHFVHLQALPVMDMDANVTLETDGFVAVVNDDAMVTFRIVVGCTTEALIVRVPVFTVPTTLAVNLWVQPGEEIWMSTSHPRKFVVNGTTSHRPMPM